ncbi:MAG: ribonuclease H-like domain-containing protein [Clostridiales bacterium]|nr:ribonuclease H-like domain-containing protein [Clostridiales bacterium]
MLHEIQELSGEEQELIESDSMKMLLAEYQAKSAKNESDEKNKLTETSTSSAPTPECPGFSLKDCLFFDIETTGLSASTAFVFLIGCISYDNGKWTLHQLFIRMVQEEKRLLQAFAELARDKRALIHFNGNTFDIPFLKKRAAANRASIGFSHFASVDLYQWFRPLKKKLSLSHMNQSYLEKVAGWERTDQMDGAEVVSLFWDYTVSKSVESEQLLLGHNHDDLVGMLRISLLEGYLALFEGKIKPDVDGEESDDQTALLLHFTTILPLPPRIEPEQPILLFSPCNPKSSQELSSDSSFPLPECQENAKTVDLICLSVSGSRGTLRIPFHHGTLRHYFPDYKNYYYLPLEKQVIHKSVAAYVAKEYRTPAKPENCFAAMEGSFLPLPHIFPQDVSFGPVMKADCRSTDYYFEYQKEFLAQKEKLTLYVTTLLSDFF